MGIAPGARAVAAAVLLGSSAHAQVRAEAGASFVRGANESVELGAGVGRAIGVYLRAGVTVSGVAWASDESAKRRVRAEGLVRFLLDPVAQERWGLSVGAGLGYRERPYLATVLEVEGPLRGGFRPVFQLALGAGVRIGAVVRRSSPRAR